MFSRLFGSSSKASTGAETGRRSEDSTSNANVQAKPTSAVRAASPTVTEPASIAASAAPGSPLRAGARSPSPVPVEGSQDVVDNPETLCALIKSCPTKTVYSYMLSQLDVGE